MSQALLAETLETGDKNRDDFHCMQMRLVMSLWSIFSYDWNDTPRWSCIFWLLGNDVIFPESRPLIFLYLYTRIRSTQKQIAEYDIKSKYTEEYSTVDKVGRENIMALRLSEYLTQLPELTMRTEVSLLHCF